MKGNIYTREKCSICGSKLIHDDRRKGFFCPEHNQVCAQKFYICFDNIFKNFSSYQEAERFLIGLRYKTDEGSYDNRDYKSGNPLGWITLVNQYIEVKSVDVGAKHLATIRRYLLNKAGKYWRKKSIKNIGYAEIEDLLMKYRDLSAKTRSNFKSVLHDFWNWLVKRRVLKLDQMPEFPETPYELGWRNIVDKETQEAIIEEVKRISFHFNPKIWLGIRWLSIYIAARPGEIISLTEGEIDTNMKSLIIPHPKEKRPKIIRLLDEDVEFLKKMPRGQSSEKFFKHDKPRSGATPGEAFGENYFYKWWKRACENLKIEGIDLYGGTRHTTATALREFFSPEQIRRDGTRHSSKAFDRYLQAQNVDSLKMAKAITEMTKKKEDGRAVEIKRKSKRKGK